MPYMKMSTIIFSKRHFFKTATNISVCSKTLKLSINKKCKNYI